MSITSGARKPNITLETGCPKSKKEIKLLYNREVPRLPLYVQDYVQEYVQRFWRESVRKVYTESTYEARLIPKVDTGST